MSKYFLFQEIHLKGKKKKKQNTHHAVVIYIPVKKKCDYLSICQCQILLSWFQSHCNRKIKISFFTSVSGRLIKNCEVLNCCTGLSTVLITKNLACVEIIKAEQNQESGMLLPLPVIIHLKIITQLFLQSQLDSPFLFTALLLDK